MLKSKQEKNKGFFFFHIREEVITLCFLPRISWRLQTSLQDHPPPLVGAESILCLVIGESEARGCFTYSIAFIGKCLWLGAYL